MKRALITLPNGEHVELRWKGRKMPLIIRQLVEIAAENGGILPEGYADKL